jgi:periplasmic protein CpxP/Spy
MKRLIVVLLAIAACAPLWAQEREPLAGLGPRLPAGTWWENPRVVEALQLTAEQQGQIADLVYQHALKMVDLKATVEKSELELKARVDRSELDASAVRAAFGTFQGARAALETERFEMLLGVRQLLSPQQWQALQGLRREVAAERRTERGESRRPPLGPRSPQR